MSSSSIPNTRFALGAFAHREPGFPGLVLGDERVADLSATGAKAP